MEEVAAKEGAADSLPEGVRRRPFLLRYVRPRTGAALVLWRGGGGTGGAAGPPSRGVVGAGRGGGGGGGGVVAPGTKALGGARKPGAPRGTSPLTSQPT